METVGLFLNINKERAVSIAQWAVRYLTEHRVRVLIPLEQANQIGCEQYGSTISEIGQNAKWALTFGGDGTLLSAARCMAPFEIPVMGVNLGRLGFLTEVEITDLENALEKIIASEYKVEERLMLQATICRNGCQLEVVEALNDVVITKGGFARMLRLETLVDEQLVAVYPSDGLIISTSTGSTAYSLSAGGPIVSPVLNVIVITPICPHTLYNRSLIISDSQEVKVKTHASHTDVFLTVDGQKGVNLHPGDEVVIKRSSYAAKLIKVHHVSFYERLRTKLGNDSYDYK